MSGMAWTEHKLQACKALYGPSSSPQKISLFVNPPEFLIPSQAPPPVSPTGHRSCCRLLHLSFSLVAPRALSCFTPVHTFHQAHYGRAGELPAPRRRCSSSSGSRCCGGTRPGFPRPRRPFVWPRKTTLWRNVSRPPTVARTQPSVRGDEV
jgi:hypothetical protein